LPWLRQEAALSIPAVQPTFFAVVFRVVTAPRDWHLAGEQKETTQFRFFSYEDHTLSVSGIHPC
jgi:hypothetical protein